MRRLITAIWTVLLLGSFAVAHAQQAEPPQSDAANSARRTIQGGYNYDAVCLFADLVGGYALPTLGPNFASDARFHLERTIPEQLATGETIEWKVYTYKDNGIEGEAIGADQKFYFRQYHLDASRLPPDFRSKQYMTSSLAVNQDQAYYDVMTLYCDAVGVEFHFDNGMLQFVEISRANTD